MPIDKKQRCAYEMFQIRRRELQRTADSSGKKLPLHQYWRLNYFSNPYLVLENDDAIKNRFADIFFNTVELNQNGQLMPGPMMDNNGRLSQYFTEVMEEANWRGTIDQSVVFNAASPIKAFYEGGTPIGCLMFKDREDLPADCLVKYTKLNYAQDMMKYGRFRISPASEYSKSGYISAIKDFETQRKFRLMALKEALGGQDSFDIQGHSVRIIDGVVPLDLILDDYFLFSTCAEISYRLPTDFEADAALIVRDKVKFISLMQSALLSQFPDWEFAAEEVYYFDEYNDVPKIRNLEFWKHISYSYQREHRCILRRNVRSDQETLAPFFIELGPLGEFCEIVVAG